MNSEFDVPKSLIKRETTLGHAILVDPQDDDLLIYNWSESSKGYPANTFNSQHYYLHRVVMERMLGRELEEVELVDHISGNRFDARRSNLRLATESQNRTNSKLRNRVHECHYRGTHYYPERSAPYRAHITVNGKQKFLGYFATEEEAARAYNKAAIEVYGEFARLNNV